MADLLGDTATQRSLIMRLATGTASTGLSNCLLVILVCVFAMRETRDWFVPPTGPGFLRPGELLDDYVGHEAAQMVLLRNNWTAETLPHVQAAYKRLLDPSLQKTYEEKTMPEERKVVKDSKIVLSQFTVTGIDVLNSRHQQRRILVHGIRTLFIGSTPSPEAVTVTLGLEPDTSRGRPRGLKIMSDVPSHPLKVAGR